MRAITGEKTAFAYSDDISLKALKDAADATRAIAAAGRRKTHKIEAVKSRRWPCTAPATPRFPRRRRQGPLLERLEAMARAEDPRVKEVVASLVGTWEVVLVARSDGHLAADVRPLVRVSVTVIMEENGRREQGSAGGGGATTTPTSATRCSATTQGRGAPGPRQPRRRPGAGRLA